MKYLLTLMLLFPLVGYNQVYYQEKSKNDLRIEAREFEKTLISASGNNSTSNIQNKLGNMYQAGYGVDVDIKEAVKWYKLAAGNGNEHAMLSLGLIYERGLHEGIPNYDEIDRKSINETGWRTTSAYYYELAIESRYLSEKSKREIFNFGVLLDHRFKSVKPNYKEAHKWYQASIKENDRTYGARYRLAVMHYYGLGVGKNHTMAFSYFTKEHEIANRVIRKFLTVTKAEPDMPYLNFYVDSVVTFNIASMYMKGEGVKQSYDQAIEWFKKSSRNSLPIPKLHFIPAYYQLGKMYYHGIGVKQDFKEAEKYLEKAASIPGENVRTSWILPDVKITKDGNVKLYGPRRKATVNAMVLLAHIYRNGYGVRKNKKNDQQALGWNYFAALSGHTQSISILNTLGYDVPLMQGAVFSDYEDVFTINASIPKDFDSSYKEIIPPSKNTVFEEYNPTEFSSKQELSEMHSLARSGDINAQLALAEYYSNVKNIRKNDVSSYAWLTVAADNGSLEAIKLRNAYQQRLSESEKLMAFEFARNVILSDNKQSKRSYEKNERDRIEEEKKAVLAQLEIQKDNAMNLIEREFEVKKEQEFNKIEEAAKEREQQAKKSQEDILTANDEPSDLEKELSKIENLFNKSLITPEERRLMRNKVLGLN